MTEPDSGSGSQRLVAMLGETGCVTLARGTSHENLDQVFGAVPETRAPLAVDRLGPIAGFAAVSDDCWVAVEPNGFQGVRPELLRRLSRQRVAAAVQWGIDGSVHVAAARTGRMVFSGDLLLDATIEGLPRALQEALPSERTQADLPELGLRLVLAFVEASLLGVDLASLEFVDIAPPVVADLPVMPAEHNTLRLDAPDLLKLLTSMDPVRQRALASWCAIKACELASVHEDVRLAPLLAQLQSAQRITVTAGLLSCAAEAAQNTALAERRDPFRRSDRGPSGLEYLWAWGRQRAIDAVRACALHRAEDAALVAVEGAVASASARKVLSEFRRATKALFGNGSTDVRADEWQPPAPLKAGSKRRMVEHERRRALELQERERQRRDPFGMWTT